MHNKARDSGGVLGFLLILSSVHKAIECLPDAPTKEFIGNVLQQFMCAFASQLGCIKMRADIRSSIGDVYSDSELVRDYEV